MTTAAFEYRDYLSDFVNRFVNQGRAEGEAKGEARGEAKGEANAVLTVLATRGLDVPDSARQRITECTDLDQLETWLRRAVTAQSIDQVLAEP